MERRSKAEAVALRLADSGPALVIQRANHADIGRIRLVDVGTGTSSVILSKLWRFRFPRTVTLSHLHTAARRELRCCQLPNHKETRRWTGHGFRFAWWPEYPIRGLRHCEQSLLDVSTDESAPHRACRRIVRALEFWRCTLLNFDQ